MSHPLEPTDIPQEQRHLWWNLHSLVRERKTVNVRQQQAETWNTYTELQRLQFESEKRAIDEAVMTTKKSLRDTIATLLHSHLSVERDWGSPHWWPGKDDEDETDQVEEKIEARFDREMLNTYGTPEKLRH